MNKQHILDAIDEAKRFIKRAEENLAAVEEERVSSSTGQPYTYYRVNGQANAAMKRASMDLTRALAQVRRSQ